MTPSRKTNIRKPYPDNEPLLFREQLSLLLECLPIIPFVCDVKDSFRIRFIHPAIQTIAGYSPETVTITPDFWKAHIHPEDLSMALEKLPESHNACDSPLEYRFRIADGSYKWFRDRRKLLHSTRHGARYIIGSWQDITQEKQLQMESEYRLQQVIQADKLASLGEVVAGVAHEINNPNSFITYNMPLLEETWLFLKPIITGFSKDYPEWQTSGLRIPELCQDMEEMIQAIRIGSDRITKVVSSLKDFARMDQNAPTRPVSVNEVIEKTMVIVGGQLRKAASQIKMKLSSDLPEIQGHFMKLEQVVANLLLNAANAIPVKEKGRILIATRYIHRIESVLIEVEDSGAGMKPGIMDRIFEPFFTTRRDTGGTGLGLSLSYGLIKEHSGRIGVLSKPGIGTRFTVYLPVNKDRPVELRPTILCVDDDPGVLSMLRKYFVSVKNIPLETLTRSEEVLGYIENHPEVDIVISDIMMPGMNGWDLLTQIKKKYPLITVILFSGDLDQLERKPDHARRPDYLFSKPVPLKSLLESINTIGRQKL
ncbi:MAG: response regulator [Deltaproteobacteria bacterium]|nr:response regulator [Deltaproteobacteria bacterium]